MNNKIRGYLHYNKSELIDVLIKRGLLPETIQHYNYQLYQREKKLRKKEIPNITF